MSLHGLPVVSSRMLGSLPDVVWFDILHHLEESELYLLRCSGNKRLLSFIGRMKSAFFRIMTDRSKDLKFSWPNRISEDSQLTELEVTLLDSNRIPHDLQDSSLPLNRFPKTLTRLTLEFTISSAPFANPFTVQRPTEASARLKALDEHFPCLHTLYNGIRFDGSLQYYVLPSSLTKLSAPHRYPSACFIGRDLLPPTLRYLKLSEGVGGDLQYPLSLETLISQDVDSSKLPHMPNLKALREMENYVRDWQRFPSLTALDGKLDLSFDWTGPRLKELNTRAPIFGTSYIKLPRTLERITQGGDDYTSVDTFIPHRFDPEHVRDLPPALQELHLWFGSNPSSTIGLLAHLPKTLTTLDMRYTALHASADFSLLPLTLTCLRSHNINSRNVKHLQRLTQLRELGLYGGCMTPSLARQLPRSLSSLRLSGVALTTKGYYYEPGVRLKKKYWLESPQTNALIDTLPPCLVSLVIAPTPTQTYWWKHAYDILKGLPVSLERLRLDFRFQLINIFPTASTTAADSQAPGASETAATKSTDVFSRLTRLTYLCMHAKPYPSDVGHYAAAFPRNLYAYRGPPIQPSEMRHLPKTLKFWWRQSAYEILGDVALHTGHDPVYFWIHPVEEHCVTWLDDEHCTSLRELRPFY